MIDTHNINCAKMVNIKSFPHAITVAFMNSYTNVRLKVNQVESYTCRKTNREQLRKIHQL